MSHDARADRVRQAHQIADENEPVALEAAMRVLSRRDQEATSNPLDEAQQGAPTDF